MVKPYPSTRYDLCPNCSRRMKLYNDKHTIVEHTILECKCGKLYTVGEILAYWTSYKIDEDIRKANES